MDEYCVITLLNCPGSGAKVTGIATQVVLKLWKEKPFIAGEGSSELWGVRKGGSGGIFSRLSLLSVRSLSPRWENVLETGGWMANVAIPVVFPVSGLLSEISGTMVMSRQAGITGTGGGRCLYDQIFRGD